VWNLVDEKKFKQAFVSLRGFRSHIFGPITQAMVDEYHAILDALQESSGENLLPFSIPASMMKPHAMSHVRQYQTVIHYRGEAEIQYTSLQYCDKQFFTERLNRLWERFPETPKAARVWQDGNSRDA
jgi:hypothetical protein